MVFCFTAIIIVLGDLVVPLAPHELTCTILSVRNIRLQCISMVILHFIVRSSTKCRERNSVHFLPRNMAPTRMSEVRHAFPVT